MLKFHRRAVTAAALTLLLGTITAAQPPMGGRMRMYDPAKETTISGKIDSVTQGARGHMMGTHLMVTTADGVKEVALGPSSFIADKGFTFSSGESVQVTGSSVTMGGSTFLVAREVVKDGKTLTLRDKTGRPQWSGTGMRPGMGMGNSGR